MKSIKGILSCIFTIALIVICFVSSVEIVIYHTGATNYEYKKYNVGSSIGVTDEDLRQVDEEMYAYLRGDRELLSDIKTTINGKPDVLFFNERECLHMADCQKLFLAGLKCRTAAIIIAIAILLFFIIVKDPSGVCRLVPQTTVGVAAFVGIAAFIVSRDFDKWFIKFHLAFFDNDLWLLDPATDRLINIMPENYFVDLALYCVIAFFALLAIVLVTSSIINKRNKKL